MTVGTGSYFTVRVCREMAPPERESVITRVLLVVKPGVPVLATQCGPLGSRMVFGSVGRLRLPVMDCTSRVLVLHIRTDTDDEPALDSITMPYGVLLVNCRSIAPSNTVASRASGYREM